MNSSPQLKLLGSGTIALDLLEKNTYASSAMLPLSGCDE